MTALETGRQSISKGAFPARDSRTPQVTNSCATIELLFMNDEEAYAHLESMGTKMERGLNEIIFSLGVNAVVARQGSAFCLYFMDRCPTDWHDLAARHDFSKDQKFRRKLIERGIYFFPLATKQCSVSFAHSSSDIEKTLQYCQAALSDGRVQPDPIGFWRRKIRPSCKGSV